MKYKVNVSHLRMERYVDGKPTSEEVNHRKGAVINLPEERAAKLVRNGSVTVIKEEAKPAPKPAAPTLIAAAPKSETKLEPPKGPANEPTAEPPKEPAKPVKTTGGKK